MTKEINKCPNCGHQFKDGEEYCPNCDLFIPVNDQIDQGNTFDPDETKQFKTFKEIEKNVTENYPESRFKHRNIKPDKLNDSNDSSEEAEEIIPAIEEITSEPTTELESTSTPKEEVIEETIEKVALDPVLPLEDEKNSHSASPTNEAIDSEKSQNLVAKRRNEGSKSNKPKKMIIGLSAAAVLAVGGYYVYSNEQQKSLEKDRVALVKSTQSELDNLFLSDDQVFLKKDISSDDLDKTRTQLEKLKTKEGYDELKKAFDEAENKFNKQKNMNDLFKNPVISGNELNEDAFIKDDSPISFTRISEEKDGFDILFNKAFDEAQKQKETLLSVTEKVDKLIKEDTVASSVTRKDYDEANELVNSLKDTEMKNQFQAQLKKVDTFLVKAENKKKEEAELARIAEEQRLAQVAEQQQTQGPVTNTTQPTGPGGNYRWGNREDSYIDYNDAAWAWNPGIQEQVLTEVINRGYVVEGGYTLVPKYIENGEGFYDLYATTNSKIFPKSKPEEFPLYVVTINAKTGWFKGNGPN